MWLVILVRVTTLVNIFTVLLRPFGQWLLINDMAMAMGISIRFLPLLQEEAEEIMQAKWDKKESLILTYLFISLLIMNTWLPGSLGLCDWGKGSLDIRNIKLTLAYDGTTFSGFQRQRNTHETIQEKLETAISHLTNESVTLYGAGRTDAGVHAMGQVVNFRTKSNIPADRWSLALRRYLPKEIVVYKSEEVPQEFHARYSAISKTYVYWIWREAWPSVFNQRYTLHYSTALDVNAIKSVIPLIIGRHDFKCFASTGTEVKETIRTISRLDLETTEDSWRIWINADGFLYHMVRNIVGTLLWVGERKLSSLEIEKAIEWDVDTKLGPTVPAHGLCLRDVNYACRY